MYMCTFARGCGIWMDVCICVRALYFYLRFLHTCVLICISSTTFLFPINKNRYITVLVFHVRVYMCICACVKVCIYMHACVYMHAFEYICVRVYIYIYIYMFCMYVYICVCGVRVYMEVWMCSCVYVRILYTFTCHCEKYDIQY